MQTVRRLGHLIGHEWKLLLALVLLWYVALVIGNQLIGADHQASPATPPRTESSPASAVDWPAHGGALDQRARATFDW
jgi:hypothetical protein